MKCQQSEPLLSELEDGLSCSSEEETRQLGLHLASFLPKGAILLFHGNLGSGKTTLIKGIGEGLGIDPSQITSPTFSLMHFYKGNRALYHFDLYRLQGIKEFLALGFHELFDEEGLFCIEWPERLEGFSLGKPLYDVHIVSLSSHERFITLKKL